MTRPEEEFKFSSKERGSLHHVSNKYISSTGLRCPVHPTNIINNLFMIIRTSYGVMTSLITIQTSVGFTVIRGKTSSALALFYTRGCAGGD